MIVPHKKGEIVPFKWSSNFARSHNLPSYWEEDGWHCDETGNLAKKPEPETAVESN